VNYTRINFYHAGYYMWDMIRVESMGNNWCLGLIVSLYGFFTVDRCL